MTADHRGVSDEPNAQDARQDRRLDKRSEAFHIAGGDATLLLGDREVRVTAGGFVFIPRGMPHTAWNSGDGPMLGLIMISPGDAEHVFEPVQAS